MDLVLSLVVVRSFFLTDPSGFVLTVCTEANPAYGMVMVIPPLPEEGVVIERTTGETELRFPIRSGNVIAGWGFLTLEERPFRRSVRNIEEGTGAVLSGFRRSLLSLGLG